jgi:hypothetical protein
MTPAGSLAPAGAVVPRGRRPWFAMAAFTMLFAASFVFVEAWLFGRGLVTHQLSVHVSLVATLLIVLSAALYVAHAVVRVSGIGVVASNLAAIGASGIIGASLVRWIEVKWLASGTLDYAGHFEALTWLSAAAVYGNLVVEDIYRTRAAGGLVMSTVVAALGLAAWLIVVSPAAETTFVELALAYVKHAADVTTVIGVSAFVAIGAIALVSIANPILAGARRRGWRRWPLRGAPVCERALFWAMVGGFCALSLALLFDFVSQLLLRADASGFDPGLPALWLDFAVLFLAFRIRRWPREVLAQFAIVAVLIGLIGYIAPMLYESVARSTP